MIMGTLAFPDPENSVRAWNPPQLTTPVVLSVPHAGIATAGFEDALVPHLDVRCDADLFVDRLYGVSESRTDLDYEMTRALPYVVARTSRFVCDMNRHPDDVTAAIVPAHPAPRNTDGRGFVWAVTTTGSPALRHPLALAEWEARQHIHQAYYAAIRHALTRARAQFGFAVLIDGHSMPSVGRKGHKDTGQVRADVVPGDRDGTSCSGVLSSAVGKHFLERGFSVAFNDPYKGGFITTHHGQPRSDVHAIQIELSRDLYMDEPSFAIQPNGFARLQSTLADLVASLATLRP